MRRRENKKEMLMLMVTFPLWGSAVFGRAPSSPLSVAGVHWGLLGVKPPFSRATLEAH